MLNTGLDKSRRKAKGARLKDQDQDQEREKGERCLHVAVGVIKDSEGQVLISLRHDKAHQGGLWEFPGGKVESGESVEEALARELKEELGISVLEFTPLIKVEHQYVDLKVLLDVWLVTLFSGKPVGCEGQDIRLVNPENLADYSFPVANAPIIVAARLPGEYAILNAGKDADLLTDLKTILNNGVKLIQARLKRVSEKEVMRFFELAIPLCKEKGAKLLVNSAVINTACINVDGIHLTTQDLLALKQRPVGYEWVAASCHNRMELEHAAQIGVDFVVLAPVLPTKTHPEAEAMGWDKFEALTSSANIPVFALGGMKRQDKTVSLSAGAQGIAGITTFL
jgi:8-oxo-dGTP diphosphatase